jgi:tetratricopeptide (TPR) repeat protein
MIAYAASEIFRQNNSYNLEDSQVLAETLRLAELSNVDRDKQYMAQIFSQAYYFLGEFYIPDDGNCKIYQQMCEKALDAFRLSTKIDRKFYDFFAEQSFIKQGVTLEAMDRLEEAVETYSEFIQLAPNSQLVTIGRGNRAAIYLYKGDAQKALSEIEIVCENSNDPFHAFWLSVKGRAELLLGREESAKKTFVNVKQSLNQNEYVRDKILDDLDQLSRIKPRLKPTIESITSSLKSSTN